MLKKPALIALIIVSILALNSSPAQGSDNTVKFDCLSQMEGLGTFNSNCFIKGVKVRIVMNVSGKESVFISDSQKSYLLIPSENTAMPVPISYASSQVPVPTAYKDIPGLQKVGEEAIDGRACDIYVYNEKGNSHKIWVAKDIDFPIKAESMTEKGKVVSFLSNVQKNIPLDDSLFQLPAGTQIIDADALMKGMGNLVP